MGEGGSARPVVGVENGIKIHLCARLMGLTCGLVKKSQINVLMNRVAPRRRLFARLFYYLRGISRRDTQRRF